MNPYDHEDAFKSANRCAGRLTNLSEALKVADNENQARLIIEDCQDKYRKIFDAFIEGVAWAREQAKEIKC